MFKQIKQWWSGEFTPTPLKSVLSGEAFENVTRPWPVRVGRAIWRFYMRHWQWLWSTAIAVVTIYVSALAIK